MPTENRYAYREMRVHTTKTGEACNLLCVSGLRTKLACRRLQMCLQMCLLVWFASMILGVLKIIVKTAHWCPELDHWKSGLSTSAYH